VSVKILICELLLYFRTEFRLPWWAATLLLNRRAKKYEEEYIHGELWKVLTSCSLDGLAHVTRVDVCSVLKVCIFLTNCLRDKILGWPG
jgi:hypothetical protein